MSEIREIYLDKDGSLVLEKDILSALHLRDSKVKCIIVGDQIILRSSTSLSKKLCGCCGEESEEDYDFHVEIESIHHEPKQKHHHI